MVDDLGADEVRAGLEHGPRVDDVAQLVVVRPQITGKLAFAEKRRVEDALDALPLEVVVIDRVVIFQHLDVGYQHARVVLEELLPAPDVLVVAKVLQRVDLGRYARSAPLEGVAHGLAVGLEHVQAVGVDDGAQLFQGVVHARLVVLAVVEDLRDAQDAVVGERSAAGAEGFFHLVVDDGEHEGNATRRRIWRGEKVQPVPGPLCVDAPLHALARGRHLEKHV